MRRLDFTDQLARLRLPNAEIALHTRANANLFADPEHCNLILQREAHHWLLLVPPPNIHEAFLSMTRPNIVLGIRLQRVCAGDELLRDYCLIWCEGLGLPNLDLLRIGRARNNERVAEFEQ